MTVTNLSKKEFAHFAPFRVLLDGIPHHFRVALRLLVKHGARILPSYLLKVLLLFQFMHKFFVVLKCNFLTALLRPCILSLILLAFVLAAILVTFVGLALLLFSFVEAFHPFENQSICVNCLTILLLLFLRLCDRRCEVAKSIAVIFTLAKAIHRQQVTLKIVSRVESRPDDDKEEKQ